MWRLVCFMSIPRRRLKKKKKNNYIINIEQKRGTIYDRNMRPLALNVAVDSLYAKPRTMTEKNKTEAVEKLSKLLNVSPQFLSERLSRKKYFFWLLRKLPAEIVEKIKALHIQGLDFVRERKRDRKSVV